MAEHDPGAEDEVPSGFYALSALLGGTRELSGFAMDRFPVTVARYSAFVDAGGYEAEELWDDDGWAWRTEHAIASPRWWEPETDPHWRQFLTLERPIVGVSWFEARAF